MVMKKNKKRVEILHEGSVQYGSVGTPRPIRGKSKSLTRALGRGTL